MSGRKNAGFVKKSPSLESTASVGGIGAGARVASATPAEDPNAEAVASSFIYHCASMLIYCPKHNVVGLQRLHNKKGLFFPTVAVFSGESYESMARNKLRRVLQASGGKTAKGYVAFSQLDVLHYFRLMVPGVNEFAMRVVFLTKLVDSGACCGNVPALTWLTFTEATDRFSPRMWGIEVQVLTETYCAPNSTEMKGQLYEMNIREARKHLPKSDKKPTEKQFLVKSAGYSDADVMRMFLEFVQHCFPSQYMNLASFNDYLTAIVFFQDDQAKKEVANYFRAFCFDQPWISFEEFLLGMAATEISTPMAGPTGEMRVSYLFRYYNTNGNKQLEYSEVRRLVQDGLRAKRETHDEAAVERAALAMYQALHLPHKSPLTLEKLKEAVGSLTLRGTSAIFRSAFSFKRCFQAAMPYPVIEEGTSSVYDLMTGGKFKAKPRCPSCREKKYTLAAHSCTLSTEGIIVDPVQVQQEDVNRAPQDVRRADYELFGENLANVSMDLIRNYSEVMKILPETSRAGPGRKVKSYLSGDRLVLLDRLNQLFTKAEAIFKREARVLKIQSPVFVFGDLHGNLHDLLLFERRKWSKGPSMEAANFLFLGDYVDRGPCSLEIIIYLFALKIISPQEVFLLRGNHEIRSINRSFTFYKELVEKLGSEQGPIFWERLNTVFDSMPVCAVIDESIFCAHGGIPTSVTKLEELAMMPMPLSDPESQFPAAHEMLWNDPINANEYEEYINLIRSQAGASSTLNMATNGFLTNTKRGTAYYWAEEATKTFLKANGLTHIIRAHEVCQIGYQYHHKGKVTTVFSSSKYGNGLNDAACIFVDQGKLRAEKLDTDV